MPGIEDQPPSADQVSIIRQKFQEYITENGKGTLIISSVLNLALFDMKAGDITIGSILL